VLASITDHDDESLDPTSWSFTIRGADNVGVMTNPGTYTQMVTHNGVLYAVEDVGDGYYFAADGFHKDTGLRMNGIRLTRTSGPKFDSGIGPRAQSRCGIRPS